VLGPPYVHPNSMHLICTTVRTGSSLASAAFFGPSERDQSRSASFAVSSKEPTAKLHPFAQICPQKAQPYRVPAHPIVVHPIGCPRALQSAPNPRWRQPRLRLCRGAPPIVGSPVSPDSPEKAGTPSMSPSSPTRLLRHPAGTCPARSARRSARDLSTKFGRET
jgi:hypothetical protein